MRLTGAPVKARSGAPDTAPSVDPAAARTGAPVAALSVAAVAALSVADMLIAASGNSGEVAIAGLSITAFASAKIGTEEKQICIPPGW